MHEGQRGRPSRRTILKWGLGVAGIAALDQLPRIPELASSKSEIRFDARQTEIMKAKKAACIAFAPSNFANADKISDWTKPALEQLGGIGSVHYAKDGLHTEEIAQEIKRLKQSGVTEFSFYLNSLGAQVAGKTMLDLQALGEDINIKHILMDCVPPSLDYVDNSGIAKITEDLPPTSTITGIANWAVHKQPFAADGTYPGLWDEQLQTLDGEYYIHVLQKYTTSNTKVSLFTPEDPEKDTVVNAFQARRRLGEIFPGLRVYYLKGNFQQHAIFPGNKDEYHKAFSEAIAA